MFVEKCDTGYRESGGISLKGLAHGQKTHLVEFKMKAGSKLPAHSHSHEQTGYLVSGRIRLFIGDESRECAPGDSWSVPSGVPHYAEILEDSLALEVFSPLREDYL
jgi:quercetin dioxygenase-like cupin family protein